MGASMAQSMSRLSGRRSAVMFAATRRSVLLFLIGVFVIDRDNSWKHKRIMGVLQRLAVAYFFTFAIRIFLSSKPSAVKIRDFQNEVRVSIYFHATRR
jgi:predicted acyltransferase